jgi:oligo-1,6-glucosidase
MANAHHEVVWWKEAIVYQVYPRSFKDGSGDGIGDLKGILQKLDYIQSLGVTALWLNPIYKSPNFDGGYDISDYCSIHPEFGNMEDFDKLIEGLHQRGLRLIMDIVVNHSSDEHQWFVESRKSKDNKYRHYYIWKKSEDGLPPNNWPSFFSGSAWQYDETTKEYYLHLFSTKQPDLNWESEDLRREVKDMMRFWLDKGVDGLRLDVISCISKRTDFPDTDTEDFNDTIRKYYANGPRLMEFIKEMRHEVWDQYDVMTVGEGPGITTSNAMSYLSPSDGLTMIFHFGHMFMDQGPGGRFDPVPWTLKRFKSVFKQWDDALSNNGWGSVFLGNHDFARMVSRWGDDKKYHAESAKLLLTLLMTMRGTPFIYQGDEIGMTNTRLTSILQSKDVETINGWEQAKNKGITEQNFLNVANYSGRDNARTPFQWSAETHAGFSEVPPWIDVNPNYNSINAAIQESDQISILNYFRKVVELRKNNRALVYGSYKPLETDNEDQLFVFVREWKSEKWKVVLNFSGSTIINNKAGEEDNLSYTKVIGNYATGVQGQYIRPWEAVVWKATNE